MPTTVGQWIKRVVVPLALAAFAALMCAGPGALLAPSTAQLVAPLVCPPGTAFQRSEHPGTDSQGTPVTYISMNCTGADNAGQPAEVRLFVVLGVIYFVMFGAVAVGAVAGLNAAVHRARPARPLGADEQRRVRAMLAQGRKLDAILLARQLTGAGLAQAKDYVETLAATSPQAK